MNIIFLFNIAKSIYPLLYILVILLFLLALTYFKLKIKIFKNKLALKKTRLYLISLNLTILTAIIYWIVDTRILDLPDPDILLIFYVLIFMLIFGLRQTLFLFLPVFGFLLYYLYIILSFKSHIINPNLFIYEVFVGVPVALIVGYAVRYYMKKLLRRNEELQQLIKLRDQFASIASHELKTPMSVIKLYVQYVLKKYSGDKRFAEVCSKLTLADKEIEKMSLLIANFLDYSRIQGNKFVLNKKLFDLNGLCKEQIKFMRELKPDYNFTFTLLKLKANIFADQLYIGQVLTNILTNAARYSPSGTTIDLKLQKNNGEYVLSVRDQGIGIEKKRLRYIFKPFYQAGAKSDLAGNDQGKARSSGGLGLGLYISQEIIKLHAGSIKIDSTVGKGSTFYITLPTAIPVQRGEPA